MYYIKNKDNRFIIADGGVNIVGNSDILAVTILAKGHEFKEIRDFFLSIESDITIYGCIVQEDGKETDEFVSNVIPTFTALKGVAYDTVEDTYTVSLLAPDNTELRLRNLEKSLEGYTKGSDLESRVTALEKTVNEIKETLNKR